MVFFNRQGRGRALLPAAALAVAGILGCGGGNGDWIDPGVNPTPGGGSLETVPLGGLKWMKKNLNVPTEDSWCYDGITANCNKYGRLYTWEAAKSACRSVGMRLPSKQEWEALVDAVGGWDVAGRKLKARSGWYDDGNGTDQYGFSALPGGHQYSGGYFGFAGNVGYWWTATEGSDGDAYNRSMYYHNDYVDEDNNDQSYGFSARCVQD